MPWSLHVPLEESLSTTPDYVDEEVLDLAVLLMMTSSFFMWCFESSHRFFFFNHQRRENEL